MPPEEQVRGLVDTGDSSESDDLLCEIEEDCEDFEAGLDDSDLVAPDPVRAGWVSAARDFLPWIVGLSAVAGVLALVALALWRWLFALPRDVTGAYRRLRRLGRFASVPLQEHQTPHQWGTLLAAAVPERGREIRRIVNAYARHTYAGTRDEPGEPDPSIVEAWKVVRGRWPGTPCAGGRSEDRTGESAR